MAEKNCIICGCYSTRPFCPSCEEKAFYYLDIISEYIKECPFPTVMTTYLEKRVPLQVIYGLNEMGLVDIIASNGQIIVDKGSFLSKRSS